MLDASPWTFIGGFRAYAISTEIPYAGPFSRQRFLQLSVVYEPKMEIFTYRPDSIHMFPPSPLNTIVGITLHACT